MLAVIRDASAVFSEALPGLITDHVGGAASRMMAGEVGSHTTAIALRLVRGSQNGPHDGYVLVHVITDLDALRDDETRNTVVIVQQGERWNRYPLVRGLDRCSLSEDSLAEITALVGEHAIRYARAGYTVDSVTVTDIYPEGWVRLGISDANAMRHFRNHNQDLTDAWIEAREAQGLSVA